MSRRGTSPPIKGRDVASFGFELIPDEAEIEAEAGVANKPGTPPKPAQNGRAAAPLLRGLWRLFVHLIERVDERLGLLEIRCEPHPGHLQRQELISGFRRRGDARELGATSRVLTALFGIAWHGLLRQI
jgi:hypothetical protein